MLAEKIEIPVVSEYITKDKYWFANFTCKGYSISSPEWFWSGHECKLTRAKILENFALYIRS